MGMIQNETKLLMFLYAKKITLVIFLAVCIYIFGYFAGLAQYQPETIKVILNNPISILKRS
ncbi:MAG: hypothetical protein JNL11_20770 [Bdellovibrionaceae bacterium]|nr:hypothetical protein [Pseudobdellovibrionaceae bacterium]